MKTIMISLSLLSNIMPNTAAKIYAYLFQSPRRNNKSRSGTTDSRNYSVKVHNGIAYHCWNESGDKTILFMHGWEGHSHNFKPIILKLVDSGYRVVSIDGPGHGRSQGSRANPFLFAKTIQEAALFFGGPYALVGHSMGAVSAAYIASLKVVQPSKLILVAAPANLEGVLSRFCQFVGMSKKSSYFFFNEMKKQTGHAAQEVNPVRLGEGLSDIEGLILHCRDDKEVPYNDSLELSKYWKNGSLITLEYLGHRRILKDDSVNETIYNFINV